MADHARNAEKVREAVRLDVDGEDVLVVFLVRDQRLAAGLDERVVVVDEMHAAGAVGEGWEVPEDAAARVDEEDAIVPAVGDEDGARQRAAVGDDAVWVGFGFSVVVPAGPPAECCPCWTNAPRSAIAASTARTMARRAHAETLAVAL